MADEMASMIVTFWVSGNCLSSKIFNESTSDLLCPNDPEQLKNKPINVRRVIGIRI
jgi:hypothetical protein